MSDANRVLWSEGLFLRTQHFQQQDRFFETVARGDLAVARADVEITASCFCRVGSDCCD